ncbi:MAG: hypothetical protein ABR595_03220 [Psychroflexus sp.]
MSLKSVVFLFLLYSFYLTSAQNINDDKQSLQSSLRQSEFSALLRNYFMNTVNADDLPDFYTNATGGYLKIETPKFKGFQFGLRGFFAYKTFGNNLNVNSEEFDRVAKWEYELYDLKHKEQFQNLSRLDQLYIKYSNDNFYISFGKIEVETTPLLNHADGRMNYFAFQGTWFNYKFSQQSIDLAWITDVSPRSTYQWTGLENALGIFSNGYQPDGSLADYRFQYDPKGIAILQYRWNQKQWMFQFNNWYLDDLMNIVWIESKRRWRNFEVGLQYSYQFPDQSHADLPYKNRYIQPNENGQAISTQLLWKHPKWHLSLAYTHAFDSGRYLFPKSLGRDQFYTSITRGGRLEGLGNVDVIMLKGVFDLPVTDLKFSYEAQSLLGAETEIYKFNKYNRDEYFQLNSRLEYEFDQILKGFSLELLWVYKQNKNNHNPESVFNRSDFNQLNVITNFSF